jgi:hypothetical protein
MDIAQYRRAETAAIQALGNWRHGQAMLPITFERVGFPVHVESVADLLQMVDTMQEGRFSLYMRELGGVTQDEVSLLVAALAEYAYFHAATFHGTQVPLPLSTMMAHLALMTKLRPWITRDSRVLEIGPGCGYLPFLIKGQVRSYHQIETTESFYMLQHLVNAWCYRDRARECAAEAAPARVHPLFATLPQDEIAVVDIADGEPEAIHWPWWLAGGTAGQFDVITSNANLNEMSETALSCYASLMQRTLAPNGALVAQCIGGGSTPVPRIYEVLANVGLKCLFLSGREPFVVHNAVFVPGPWDGPREGEFVEMDDPKIRAMFVRDDARRRIYSGPEVAEMVRAKLTSRDRRDASGLGGMVARFFTKG